MTRFEKIAAHVPAGTVLPPELQVVCDELDHRGYPVSGGMKLRADEGGGLVAWLGGDPAMASQFAPFGAGPDGSFLAFWLLGGADARQAPVVHLGSEGGHCMVLAANFREFLRLFAIGYTELGFDDLSQPPSDPASASWLRTLLRERYQFDPPEVGSGIVSEAQAAVPSLEAAVEDWFKRRHGDAA